MPCKQITTPQNNKSENWSAMIGLLYFVRLVVYYDINKVARIPLTNRVFPRVNYCSSHTRASINATLIAKPQFEQWYVSPYRMDYTHITPALFLSKTLSFIIAISLTDN